MKWTQVIVESEIVGGGRYVIERAGRASGDGWNAWFSEPGCMRMWLSVNGFPTFEAAEQACERHAELVRSGLDKFKAAILAGVPRR